MFNLLAAIEATGDVTGRELIAAAFALTNEFTECPNCEGCGEVEESRRKWIQCPVCKGHGDLTNTELAAYNDQIGTFVPVNYLQA